MSQYRVVFLVCAIACFVIKALGVKTGQVDLFSAGFAFLAASLLP